MSKSYSVNEVFVSPQGEGCRSGVLYQFVRFSGCNLTCSWDSEAGFDCDTDFSNGEPMEPEQLLDVLEGNRTEHHGWLEWVCFTGGEPMLQLDADLVEALLTRDFRIALETNGTVPLGERIVGLLNDAPQSWVCLSPKTAWHTIRLEYAKEVKIVLPAGRAVPKIPPRFHGAHWLLSPVFGPEGMDYQSLAWCLKQQRRDPRWRLSLQTHKLMGVR